ncbi:hypothetical protein Agabi119p4_10 [Agaricus bisporus var. burnettii]|uniref:Uncharacterized protein n=1 Tax=Agaricus bisporus var. burnettii TaxID=192524 RepID=A0A8H7F9W7_AGABI|nr:hypothetical protein Agabi119p4_10 [Agaricus bisporus var. burnettii]
MPYFNSKEFHISDDGRITILKRPKSDDSEDAISKANSGIGRMIEIGQGAATRVIATPVVKVQHIHYHIKIQL